jgi:predicted glycogen debranching enzyme
MNASTNASTNGSVNAAAEWLETDGLGGYAMGRADGARTRRYHALLTVSRQPPTERVTLVNGFDAWVETSAGRYPITTQHYAPDVAHPGGTQALAHFRTSPWPTWHFRLPDGTEVVQELVMLHGSPLVALAWHLTEPTSAQLVVRPFLSVRDTHHTTHENGDFDFQPRVAGHRIDWRPYRTMPAITAVTNGDFTPEASWYRNFRYDEEAARGLDFLEDLACPGEIRFSLRGERAILAFGSDTAGSAALLNARAVRLWDTVTATERARRKAFRTPWHRAADAYVVTRGTGRTIVAGYPWFSDWGRDTFIAMRGLCLAGQRLADARAILVEWAQHVNQGMLPNFFPEGGASAEYNSVDASLWYVVAVHDFLAAVEGGAPNADGDAARLGRAVCDIVEGYARGTRYGIRADGTGLLAAGEPGVQLTWMDAKVGDWVVTPRIGKPVEVQALWINALRIAARWDERWGKLAQVAQASFAERFWNEDAGCCHDVVDDGHVAGRVDSAIRPNQLLAVGGLPWPVLTGERARRVVDLAEQLLWTPAGLRSLAPTDAEYRGQYHGDMRTRDGSYHQGTVWPWLAGAFIDAWVRVRGSDDAARREARTRFLQPLLGHYERSAPGQLGEIADGDAPHRANGCPFQAWSVGEALRLSEVILHVPDPAPGDTGTRGSVAVGGAPRAVV